MLNVFRFSELSGGLAGREREGRCCQRRRSSGRSHHAKIARQVLADVLKNCVGVFSVVSRSWIGR